MYPWHEEINQRLMSQFQQKKLAHALLFAGQRYVGKFDYAVQLANQLLCETHDRCGNCKFCHLLEAGTHPDFKIIEPEEDSRQIKIEQVRGLVEWVNQTAQMSGMKVAILNPAEQMNVSSMNALLKCLEEPSANTLIILISPRPASLLPTIRSRCQQVPFSIPPRHQALAWLKSELPGRDDIETLLDMSGGAALAVIEKYDLEFIQRRKTIVEVWTQLMQKRPGAIDGAASLGKIDLEEVFEVSMSLFADVSKSLQGVDKANLQNKDILASIEAIAANLTPLTAHNIYVRLQKDLGLHLSTANPNKTLLLEALFIDCGQQKLQSYAEYSL